jgi:hypothetical protein
MPVFLALSKRVRSMAGTGFSLVFIASELSASLSPEPYRSKNQVISSHTHGFPFPALKNIMNTTSCYPSGTPPVQCIL